jgi:hypothetical protein
MHFLHSLSQAPEFGWSRARMGLYSFLNEHRKPARRQPPLVHALRDSARNSRTNRIGSSPISTS